MSLKKWILVGAVFLVLLTVACLLIKPSPPPPIKLPNPNGYDDLVKAGQMIAGQIPDCDFDDSECIEAVKIFITKNEKALDLARVGLDRESRVPIGRTNHAVGIFKSVALSFQAEGQIAERENRLDDAVKSYLDVIRCSQQIRGGTIIDALVSLAVESVGMASLQKIAGKMSVDQRQNVIRTLSNVSTNRQTFNEVMKMEKINNRYTTTLRDKLSNLRYYFSSRDVARKLSERMKYHQARMDLLLVDLAMSNYQLDKKHPPGALVELVPTYLPFLPKDNFSGNDFIYRPRSNGFELYGVGYNGKDDGGKPLSDRTTEATGDMLTTSPF